MQSPVAQGGSVSGPFRCFCPGPQQAVGQKAASLPRQLEGIEVFVHAGPRDRPEWDDHLGLRFADEHCRLRLPSHSGWAGARITAIS